LCGIDPITVIIGSVAYSRSIVAYSLKEWGEPDRANPHIFQVFQFLDQACDVASPKAAVFDLRLAIAGKTIHRISRARVIGIYIWIKRIMSVKTIREREINCSATVILSLV